MPKQPVSKKKALPRHLASPKEVLLKLEVRTNHLRSSHSTMLKPKN